MPMVRQEHPAKRRRVAVIEMTALCSNRELGLWARVSGPVRAAATESSPARVPYRMGRCATAVAHHHERPRVTIE